MIHERLKEALLQGEEREAAGLMQDLLRRSVRLGLYEAMAAEVEALCGPKHRPDPESEFRRAGSERGIAYVDGGKEEIVRPRVRQKEGSEVRLATYEAASSPQSLFDRVVAAVAEGLPIRGAERATSRAISKSEASRMWVEKSREQLEELRTRRLDDRPWLAVLIDGVRLAEEAWVIVAVGIDLRGEKQVLDFEQGSSENATAVAELLERLARRGVREPSDRRLLVLRDGSEAIHRAVQQHWPSAVQQECLVHAHVNVRDKVKRRDRADVDRHFKTLRHAQGHEAGAEAFEELLEFLSERNGAAAVALKARRDRLLAFHRLGVPATLNRSFLSTNLIENVLRNWREATGNVKRWSEKADMIPRWMASGLLWAEAGFRRIPHAEDLSHLLAALSSNRGTEPAS